MIDLDSLIRDLDPSHGVAVPPGDEAEARRRGAGRGRPRRSLEALSVSLAVVIALGVVAIVVTARHGQPRAQVRSTPTVAKRAQPLLRILGVLRRPQTAADKAAVPKMERRGEPDLSLIRLAAVTPWRERVILVPERSNPADTLNLMTVRRLTIGPPYVPRKRTIEPGAAVGGITPAQIEAGHASMLEGPGSGPFGGWRGVRLFMVVPDGVARVAFVVAPGSRSASGGGPDYANGPAVTVPVHDNVAFAQLKTYCCGGGPVTRWYAKDGRLIKITGSPVRAGHGRGAPAINLSPGVVTVAHLRLPTGTPFTLTLQRIRFQRRQYVCLADAYGSGSTQECPGPLPLPDRPLVAVMSSPTVCKPHPEQLIWGLALSSVKVSLRAGGRDTTAIRRPIPAALGARGNLFYVWARSSPDSLVVQDSSGHTTETYPINTSRQPEFAVECRHQPPGGTGAPFLSLQTSRP